jgi:hypothetical protein
MNDARDPATKPLARASCARVIKEIEAQKRAMRMIPTPKPADTVALEEQRRKARQRELEMLGPTEEPRSRHTTRRAPVRDAGIPTSR